MEEGGDDVKSSWPLCPGLHTYYNGRYRGLRYRKMEGIPQSRPQFRLWAAIRPHEGGIASNRRSAGCGEYVPGPCTHRPSHHERMLLVDTLKLRIRDYYLYGAFIRILFSWHYKAGIWSAKAVRYGCCRKRAYSSVSQSAPLIRVRSVVQLHIGPPVK